MQWNSEIFLANIAQILAKYEHSNVGTVFNVNNGQDIVNTNNNGLLLFRYWADL